VNARAHADTDRDRQTRARLLDAATRLFADRGFRKVTVREICHEAGANIAAINYYFGDKMGLYREVLQSAVDVLRAVTADARAGGQGKPPEQRLEVFIRIMLQRLLQFGTDTPMHRLMMHEMSDPTPALDMVVEQGLRPRLEYVSTIVADLLQCPVDDPRVLICAGSVHALCLMARPNPVAARLMPDHLFSEKDIDGLTAHIASFSLAGIRAIAQQAPPPRPRGPQRRGLPRERYTIRPS
jgi:TetR/AcrR family transcriptional regulator, regulator of cefoperazone and chloramphenicol sensitivity